MPAGPTEPIVYAGGGEKRLLGSPGFVVPAAIANIGPEAAEAFIEYFTASIRNANTREAYGRAVTTYLAWCEENGLPFEQIKPVHVAAYVELLGQTKAPATVKQHLAAIRMIGGFLLTRGIAERNPAAEVRGPSHVVRVGKTPALTGEDCRKLLASIDEVPLAGTRDRALLAIMVYTFGRVSAVLNLKPHDVYQVGQHIKVMFREKGGRDHEMPLHRVAADHLAAYAERTGIELGKRDQRPLFRTINRERSAFTDRGMTRKDSWAMVKRRCKAAGVGDRFNNHSFRATGITAYLDHDGRLEQAQLMAGHAKPETTKLYDRRHQATTLDEIDRIIL